MRNTLKTFCVFLGMSVSLLTGCENSLAKTPYFDISVTSQAFYLDEPNIVRFSVNSYFFENEINLSEVTVIYYIEGENNIEAVIDGDTFVASSIGKVIVKGQIPALNLISTNSFEISTRYSENKISENIQAVMDGQIIFGQTYDVGITSDEVSSFSILNADEIIRLNTKGEIEVIGIGTGTLTIKNSANETIFQNYYSVYNSILCTKIKEILIEQQLIASKSSNVTHSMLSNVTSLNLSGELINDPTSSYGVRFLTQIEELDLSYNGLSDLSFLSELVTLKKVNLAHNEIKDIDAIVDNQGLQYLNISFNEVTDLKKLQYLHDIEYLDLSNNQINNINYLSTIYSLKSLFINNNLVQNFRDSLSGLENLTELGVGYCGISFADIRSLNYLDNLTYLDISGTDPSLENIAPLDQLETLILKDCKLDTGKDIGVLNQLTLLKKLDISENGLDAETYGQGLSATSLTHLTSLGIGGNEFIEIPDLSGFLELSVLDLSGSYNLLSLSSIDDLNLTTLILDECNSIVTSDNGAQYRMSIEKMTNLTKLSLISGFNYMTKDLFTYLEGRIENGLEIRLFDERWIGKDTIENYAKTIFFTMLDLSQSNLQNLTNDHYDLINLGSSRHIILSLVNDTSPVAHNHFVLNVPKQVFKFDVYGNKYQNYNLAFNVLDRKESSVTFDFHDLDLRATSSSVIASAVGSKTYINTFGKTSLMSPAQRSNALVNTQGAAGFSAIQAYDVVLCNKDSSRPEALLAIKGTQGGKGGDGVNDGNWVPGNGGRGGAGIQCHSLTILSDNITIYGGNGGEGGKGEGGRFLGARGEDGGKGGDGASAIEYSGQFLTTFPTTSFFGGKGGKGGGISAYAATPFGSVGQDGANGTSVAKI